MSVANFSAALAKTGKADAAGREAALTELAAFKPSTAEEANLISLLPSVLAAHADKVKSVAEKAPAAGKALIEALHPAAAAMAVPSLLLSMDDSKKFPEIVGALKLLSDLAKDAPEYVAVQLVHIVPAVTPLLNDMKAQTREAAKACLEECAETINNKDLTPLLPHLLSALGNIAEGEECIHKLAATTFVQNVTSAALAIVAPLLVRAFKEKKTAVKRQGAVIVTNMSKLVEDPADAAPFLPQLTPALEKAKEEVSDPEARGVCEKSHAQLKRIEAAAAASSIKAADHAAVSAQTKSAGVAAELVSYVASLACALTDAKEMEMEEWNTLSKYGLKPAGIEALHAHCKVYITEEEKVEEADDAEELCNCKFTLAYGSKILLHNTTLQLKRGYRYGLLGGNDSGKTTLMRSIANGQVEGFPPADELRTVFVEADIIGDLSELACLEYIFADERIQKSGVSRERISEVMQSVGFSEKMLGDGVTTLSGGWRMKLAMARAMLQRADILLLDEPTNHLDVLNVQWTMDYLNSLSNVTSIIVSHDSKLLDEVCTHIIQISDLKLHLYKGNLTAFVEKVPEAMSYFEFKATKFSFKFPQPGFIEGVKTKGKPLMKMDNCDFTYPINDKPTIRNITVRVSMASRVACVGVNGAGKSTMIKLLTGELVPQVGTVWKHPGCRVAYVAQHAFHHIEQHLDRTPNEYIQWRYQNGDDKEALVKDSMVLTEEEEKKCSEPVEISYEDKSGKIVKSKRVLEKLTGSRKVVKKENTYEVKWANMPIEANTWMNGDKLAKLGFGKHVKCVDEKIAARAGMYVRPLTQSNVEQHLEDVGLDREFGTHHRMAALSGGQKVKVVLAAAMWNQPHVLILDEPTNYLDRDSLGALAGAIREFEGGVVMITHNSAFCEALCPETWVLENGTLDCKGDAEWMKHALEEKTEFKQVEEMVDAFGNTVAVKQQKKTLNKKEARKAKKLKEARRKRGEEVSDSDEDWD